ncbi:hypothetical protein GQ600_7541 [Phytophthora cactorum]|nr:hypothetical protein GQ600_7541 [Phytophthora cactorum]
MIICTLGGKYRYRGKRKRQRQELSSMHDILTPFCCYLDQSIAQAVRIAMCVMKKTDTQPQAQVGLQANRLSAEEVISAGSWSKYQDFLKFIVDNSDSNRTLRNVQNQIRNLKKCELGVTTRSHRVKKGLLDFCAFLATRVFMSMMFSGRTIRATRCPTEQAQWYPFPDRRIQEE